MTRQHWPDWTPHDELILAQQEVQFILKTIEKTPNWDVDKIRVLQMNLDDAMAELTKWQAIVNKK